MKFDPVAVQAAMPVIALATVVGCWRLAARLRRPFTTEHSPDPN